MSGHWFAIGAFLAGLGVLAGAFGAHGLKDQLSPEMMDIYRTAASYHLIHAIGILAVAFAADRWPGRLVQSGGALLTLGILVFSGSLYALSLTEIKILGAITPFGGVALVAGWFCLGAAALRCAPARRGGR
ncbi:MAG: DUF423 domain-containing protein [Armatimonadetes bacterium]|nr:DUF423 domain-containing protein [Armatimonadota bacterium]